MRTLRISVRGLVEFLLRSGNIDAEGDGRAGIEVMQAGSNIHRMLQAAGGPSYQAEVSLASSFYFPDGLFNPHAARLDIREEAMANQPGFFLRVEGRADGIIDDKTRPLVIDEIKGVTRDVSTIDEPSPLHVAQALVYAYLYLRNSRGATTLSTAFGERVVIRITYASMTTGEVRHIERELGVPDIEAWFFSLLDKAQRWAAWRTHHDELRAASLASLAFPFAPRDSQQQMMDAVSAAIREGRRLYVQAPTGSGKTIATLYPALKAMGAGAVAHVAFLTAKTTTRGPVLEALQMLRQQHIATNVLVMTARDKICPLRRSIGAAQVRSRPLASLCNPIECPLARGHFDRANDALHEAIASCDVLDAGTVEAVAARHHVCPYELQRDAARWADVIVCDYHYAFAPSAGLVGLADDPNSGDVVYLVDEAHNLVERMRDMYSAELSVAELLELERLLRPQVALTELTKAVQAAISAFPTWDKALPAGADSSRRGAQQNHVRVNLGDTFPESLEALATGIDASLEQLLPLASEHQDGGQAGARQSSTVELFLALRDVGFHIHAFLGTLQRAEKGYVTFLGRTDKGGRRLKIYCVDPTHDLEERLEQAKAAVFFSGTLLPMAYHRKLLAAKDEDASLFATSSFDYRRQQVFIGTDVSSRYSGRGPALYASIAAYVVELTRARPGNYLAFVPSYAMLDEVAEALGKALAPAGGSIRIVRQRPGMREDDRERFVDEFRRPHAADSSLVGLCVLGGIFGESIDLPGDSLVGVVVVGTGMPRATAEREVIKDYFDAREDKGFAYAYTYPGMIKVLQAAGRLIRTENDHGVVLLLDDRFLERELQKAFPKEWSAMRTCTLKTLPRLLATTPRP